MANQGDGNICSPSKPSSIKECEHLRAKAVAQLWAPGAYLQCGVTPWNRSVWKESRWQHFRAHEAEGHRRLNLPVVFADPTGDWNEQMGRGAMMGRASVPRIRRDRREKRLVKPATWPMTPTTK